MKSFSLKNSAAVLITLMVVIFFGASYFFVYLPHNEKIIQEQRFRLLQNIDQNIHEKIENSAALLNNLLTAYYNETILDVDREKIHKYIISYSKDNFTLKPPDSIKRGSAFDRQNIIDSGYTIEIDIVSQRVKLLFKKYQINAQSDTIGYQMAMQFSFSQFIKFLLPKNVFDEYIVLSDGQVVYETFPSGISYFKDSSLDKKRGIVGSSVKSLNVSGRDYKLFLHPVKLSADKELVVTGLLANVRYQDEKNQLPSNAVLLLVTVALIIIVAFPWIKLYQMGNKDRLTVTDGISSIVVAMLLMSLLFFMLTKYNRIFRKSDIPDSKSVLASQIIKAFKSEIDTIHGRLDSISKFVENHPGIFKDIRNLMDTAKISFKDDRKDSVFKNLQSMIKDESVNQVFWLNGKGVEVVNWTSDSLNAPHGNFDQRAYFKNIVNKQFLNNNDTSTGYYLDQVVSWTTGKFTSVLSVPLNNEDLPVAAISFNMMSLKEPVLPAGYQFAIIDNAGKVLYHLDEARNLTESLVSEFSENEKLRSCLEARTSGVFITKYFSKEYEISVEPVPGLTYFVVIFSDISYKATAEMEVYSFTFSMMWLLFSFFILQLFIIFLVSSKRSFFKKQLYDTSWIGPKVSSHYEYIIAAFFNVFVIIVAVIFLNASSFLTFLYILLISVTFISIFLNHLFAKRYKKSKQDDNHQFKLITLVWLYLLILVINLSALRTLEGENYFILLFYELLIFATGRVLYLYGRNLLVIIYRYVNWSFIVMRINKTFLSKYVDASLLIEYTNRSFISKANYSRSFSLMALTRLIITSGIPVIFFYISSYNYEQNIGIRYRHLQYDKHLPANLNGIQADSIIRSNTVAGKYYYYDHALIKDISVSKKLDIGKYTKEDSVTAEILGLFRFNFSEIAVNEARFYIPAAADSIFFYNHLLKDAYKKRNATVSYFQTSDPNNHLVLTASHLNYKFPGFFNRYGIVFWVLFFGALWIFYFIIYNILKKLFCLRLPAINVWDPLDDKIFKNKLLNKLVFVIGLPGSGKLTIMKNKLIENKFFHEDGELIYNETNPKRNNVFIADLINIPDVGTEEERNKKYDCFTNQISKFKHKLIIVNHFEYNIQDEITNRIKLNFLEDIMLMNTAKIIILSTIHPVAFLDSAITAPADTAEKSVPGQNLERWHVLLGHYRIVVFPIELSNLINKDKFNKSIYKETQYTHFLSKMQKSAIEVAQTMPPKMRDSKADELAFKLQVTAHYFYMYIWQSLTKEEKFLLYDLAEDNLVNSFDDYNLNMMIAKGVIMRRDGTLKLFNKGFRNFILTAIGNSEAMKIKNHIKDNGNWHRLKNPLVIVVLAILIFLLTSQEEAFSKLITYTAALAAGIPAILKIFSLFDRNAPKKE